MIPSPASAAPADGQPVRGAAARTRHVLLDAAGVTLSAVLSEPPCSPPHGTLVAVHGGGMTAGYFDARTRPGMSLLALGAALGWQVLAVDRPGYGHSAAALPDGMSLAEQAGLLRAAVADFTGRHEAGAGVVLLGHSFGSKLVLCTAAGGDLAGARLLGADLSGCGHRYAALPDVARQGRGSLIRHWGPLRLYPPDTFTRCQDLVAAIPPAEAAEIPEWPARFAGVAARIRVPVRLMLADHEGWWGHTPADLAAMAQRFTAAPVVRTGRLPEAGHNVSLGWAAFGYHLRVLAFAEDCAVRGGLPA